MQTEHKIKIQNEMHNQLNTRQIKGKRLKKSFINFFMLLCCFCIFFFFANCTNA